MPKKIGILRKMQTQLEGSVVYHLRIGDEQVPLNERLQQPISLVFTGNIYCIQCGRKTNKSFQQGYCFPCLRRLQECHLCILYPERCDVEKGHCPEDDWAHAQCHQAHIIYLANSSGLKVGITRHTQVPTRWMDQGARQALPIFQVSNRYQAGVVEVALKKYVSDRTNWRTMLKQEPALIDLSEARDELLKTAKQDFQAVQAALQDHLQVINDSETVEFHYPVTAYPKKITSLSLDKTPEVSGELIGIKGQYIMLDHGVMNIRKFGGYEVELDV